MSVSVWQSISPRKQQIQAWPTARGYLHIRNRVLVIAKAQKCWSWLYLGMLVLNIGEVIINLWTAWLARVCCGLRWSGMIRPRNVWKAPIDANSDAEKRSGRYRPQPWPRCRACEPKCKGCPSLYRLGISDQISYRPSLTYYNAFFSVSFFHVQLNISFVLMLKKLNLVPAIEQKTQESPYSHRLRNRRSVKTTNMAKLGFAATFLSSFTFTLTLLVLIAGVNKHILPNFYFFKVDSPLS